MGGWVGVISSNTTSIIDTKGNDNNNKNNDTTSSDNRAAMFTPFIAIGILTAQLVAGNTLQ